LQSAYAEAALFANGAMAILTLPMPRQPVSHELGRTSATTPRATVSGWEANTMASQGSDKERSTGRILLPLHCFPILSSSQRVGKVLNVWREKEAALEGPEKHLQLDTPDEKAVTAARVFMKTLTLPNGSLRVALRRQQDKVP